MLDIGWSEFLVIGVVALVVIGPRELPGALRTAGRFVARARALAQEFRDGLDDIARETEIKDIGNSIMNDDDLFDADDKAKQDGVKKDEKASETAESDRHEADADEADMADWNNIGAPDPVEMDTGEGAADEAATGEETTAEDVAPTETVAEDAPEAVAESAADAPEATEATLEVAAAEAEPEPAPVEKKARESGEAGP